LESAQLKKADRETPDRETPDRETRSKTHELHLSSLFVATRLKVTLPSKTISAAVTSIVLNPKIRMRGVMKFEFLGAAMAVFVTGSAWATEPAQRVPVLAELFTSEGCSSCPPADLLLMELDRKQPVHKAQIIVLSEHVDYWNRLGWSDPFSSAQFSARQAAYSRALKSEVYTPQLVIDGGEQLVGSDTGEILAAITRAASRPKVPVKIGAARLEGTEVVVNVSVDGGAGELWLAVADERDESSVKRGENSGRKLAHVAVVRSLVKAGDVRSSGVFDRAVRLPLAPDARPAGTRIVAFLAAPNGRILGVSMASLQP